MRATNPLGCAATIVAVLLSSTASAEITTLASRPYVGPTGYGVEGDDDSFARNGAMSVDGAWLVFSSRASNLVAGDTNGVEDVFVRENATGALVRIATGRDAVISSDGSTIAFTSDDALVGTDTNGVADVYVTGRAVISFELVSVSSAEVQGSLPSFTPSLSADGKLVAFASDVDNLTAVADTNGSSDVFVRDRAAGTTVLVSVAESGTAAAAGISRDPVISGNGLFVAFESDAVDLDTTLFTESFNDFDVFRHELSTGTTGIMSYVDLTTPSESNGESFDPAISADGLRVAFDSYATDIEFMDLNNAHDVFVRDEGEGYTERVSVAAGGQEADFHSFSPSISDDGALVAFRSAASNLTGESLGFGFEPYVRVVIGAGQTTIRLGTIDADGDTLSVALSGDGTRAAFASQMSNLPPVEVHPGHVDVFVTGTIVQGETSVEKASVASVAVPAGANGKSGFPALSSSGQYVVFESNASNLVDGDDNGVSDVFRHDTLTGTTLRVSAGEGEFDQPSDQAVISAAGARWVAFRTAQEGISSGFDVNGRPDVYVRDMQAPVGGEFELVSERTAIMARDDAKRGAGISLYSSGEPSISDDGRKVAFSSDWPDMTPGDTNAAQDVYLRDLDLDTTVRVSVATGGAEADGASARPSLSADAARVAFQSSATNLVAGDTNGVDDIFVRDVQGDTTVRVSVASGGAAANGPSANPSVSFDARYVAFDSVATNLVPGDTATRDVYVHDTVTGVTMRVSVNTRGVPGDGASHSPRISGDGRFVVFESDATNLGASTGTHTYVHDTLRRATARLDADATAFGDRNSAQPAIARGGTAYALVSDATNWTGAAAGYRTGDVNVWVGAMPRTTLLSIDSDSPDPSLPGTAVTVAYTLTASSGTPNGVVEVAAQTGETCSAPVANGACDLLLTGVGARTITAYYAGDFVSFPALSPGVTHGVEDADGPGFTGETPLVAPDGDEGDLAGSSVASNEEFVVMGAPNGADGAGAVYVFRRVTNTAPPVNAKSVAGLVAAKDLAPVATLANPNGALGIGDKWGGAVAISPDGATIVIGAPDAGGGSGMAAMFTRPGSGWVDDSTPEASLVPAGGAGIGDKFGTAVAVGTGNMIAVGAPGATSGGDVGAGAAHVFEGAAPMGTIEPDPSADAGASFGQSLAMSGGQLVIGAPFEGAGDTGSVRLFTVTADSISAPTNVTPAGLAFGDKWGTSVAIDGTTIVGGAPGASGGDGMGVVFQSGGSGVTQLGVLQGGAGAAGSGAGMAVAVAGDYILLGAPLAEVDGRPNQGRAFVFLQPDDGWSDASAIGSLVGADGEGGDGYGSAIALTRRGAIIGIPNRDLGLQDDQGQADSFVVDRIFRGAFE